MNWVDTSGSCTCTTSCDDVAYVAGRDGDMDGDAIPDYADGYNLMGCGTDDDYSTSGSTDPGLTPVAIGGVNLPQGAVIHIEYDASDPTAVTVTGTGTTEDPYVFTLPTSGSQRLWTTASACRNGNTVEDGGDYLAPGDYTVSQATGTCDTSLWVTVGSYSVDLKHLYLEEVGSPSSTENASQSESMSSSNGQNEQAETATEGATGLSVTATVDSQSISSDTQQSQVTTMIGKFVSKPSIANSDKTPGSDVIYAGFACYLSQAEMEQIFESGPNHEGYVVCTRTTDWSGVNKPHESVTRPMEKTVYTCPVIVEKVAINSADTYQLKVNSGYCWGPTEMADGSVCVDYEAVCFSLAQLDIGRQYRTDTDSWIIAQMKKESTAWGNVTMTFDVTVAVGNWSLCSKSARDKWAGKKDKPLPPVDWTEYLHKEKGFSGDESVIVPEKSVVASRKFELVFKCPQNLLEDYVIETKPVINEGPQRKDRIDSGEHFVQDLSNKRLWTTLA